MLSQRGAAVPLGDAARRERFGVFCHVGRLARIAEVHHTHLVVRSIKGYAMSADDARVETLETLEQELLRILEEIKSRCSNQVAWI